MSSKKYTGTLNKKIAIAYSPKSKSLLDDSSNIENSYIKFLDSLKIASNERDAKIKDLFEFFDLKDGDWKGLALSLADKHVRGFQFELPNEKAGRKQTWDELELLGIYFDFSLKRKFLKEKYPATIYSDADIARFLSKNDRKPLSPSRLKSLYIDAKNSLLVKTLDIANDKPDIEAIAYAIHADHPNLIKVFR